MHASLENSGIQELRKRNSGIKVQQLKFGDWKFRN